MMNHDILFGLDGIGDDDVIDELDDDLDVQKYLQRALANHVDGKKTAFVKTRFILGPFALFCIINTVGICQLCRIIFHNDTEMSLKWISYTRPADVSKL